MSPLNSFNSEMHFSHREKRSAPRRKKMENFYFTCSLDKRISRITSYNVCYTKLLRLGIGASGRGIGNLYQSLMAVEGPDKSQTVVTLQHETQIGDVLTGSEVDFLDEGSIHSGLLRRG